MTNVMKNWKTEKRNGEQSLALGGMSLGPWGHVIQHMGLPMGWKFGGRRVVTINVVTAPLLPHFQAMEMVSPTQKDWDSYNSTELWVGLSCCELRLKQ